MEMKILIVAIVENENGDVLLRKKPEGSPPYDETWYIFGAEFVANQSVEELLVQHIQKQAGITVKLRKQVGWDTEVKHDLDDIEKQFIYLDAVCEYVSGDLIWGEGIETIEWVPRDKLVEYDNVPPSVKLFKALGYIN
ncbi:MAG: hypothetical protein JWO61_243 [Candidatus Saccharibacteria bacterium]|nr:hypothetical protein [Candidatus Saccharibacteria bacterium]